MAYSNMYSVLSNRARIKELEEKGLIQTERTSTGTKVVVAGNTDKKVLQDQLVCNNSAEVANAKAKLAELKEKGLLKIVEHRNGKIFNYGVQLAGVNIPVIQIKNIDPTSSKVERMFTHTAILPEDYTMEKLDTLGDIFVLMNLAGELASMAQGFDFTWLPNEEIEDSIFYTNEIKLINDLLNK